MMLPILHKELQLQSCLSERSHARTYLATNARGQRFVVKFVFDPDLFFEEMARYYACDGSPHLCRLVYNFPAYEICSRPYFFDGDILKLFGRESLVNADGTVSETVHDSPMARMGALVFEYVQGEPLLHLLPRLSEDLKLAYLHQMAQALEDLHGNGEFHGRLTANNVLVEKDTNKVRLVGMSHGRTPDSKVGANEDVRIFALYYISALERPTTKLERLLKACLRPTPPRLPPIARIRKKLPPAGADHPARFWPAGTLLVAALLLALLGFRRLHKLVGTPPWEGADQILASRQLDVSPGPDAVFSLDGKNLLLMGEEIYKVGDSVRYAGEEGELTSIHWDSVVFSAQAQRRISLPPPGAASMMHPNRGVMIWARPNSLGHLIAALPKIADFFREDINPDITKLKPVFYAHKKTVLSSGTICGVYDVSSLMAFLEQLEQQLDIVESKGEVRVESLPGQFLHYVFKRVYFDDSTVADFGMFFENRTGIQLVIPEDLQPAVLPDLDLTKAGWEDVLKQCGFQWEVRVASNHYDIRILSMVRPSQGAG